MHLIRTEILIDAPLDRVWSVLIDFARYDEWNPLNLSIRGQAQLGARLELTFLNLLGRPGSKIRQSAKVVAFAAGREIAWSSTAPLLFHGRHGFVLTPTPIGTRVVQTEQLGGLLPAVWGANRIGETFTPHYEAVDRALAQRVAAIGEAAPGAFLAEPSSGVSAEV